MKFLIYLAGRVKLLSRSEIIILSEEDCFEFFTDLVLKRIGGGLSSKKPPQQMIESMSYIYEELVIFECPNCDQTLVIKHNESIYTCECSYTIDFSKEREFLDFRYVISKDFYTNLRDYLDKPIEFENFELKIILGEGIKSELPHNDKIYIHITPKNLWTEEVIILDENYSDHFALGWKFILKLLDEESIEQILKQSDQNNFHPRLLLPQSINFWV
jgi:hypothetical protein